MRFHPSSEQIEIQHTLRAALQDAFPPARLQALVDGEAELDRESWTALMALGVGGLLAPERFGGSGLDLLDAALAVEVLGGGAMSGPLAPHLLTTLALAAAPEAAVAEQWLPGLASGERMATVAFGGGWTPESWEVTETGGRIRGEVRFVQSAEAADVFLVGLAGAGLAIVEAGPGVRTERLAASDRTRRVSRVVFEDVPAVRLEVDAARAFDAGLVLMAADALGGAQRLTDMSVDYAKTRRQFDQPVGRFQALKHQLATMALEVESSRALVWYAAYAWDHGLPDARRVAAICKAHLADRFVSVSRAAIAAHGGIGYTWEYQAGVWLKRAFFDRAYLGGPSMHRARAAEMAAWSAVDTPDEALVQTNLTR